MPLLARLALVTGLGVCSAFASAQARQPGALARPGATPTVSVAMTIAGQRHQFSGPGRCTYTPAAEIYQTRAEMWSAQHAAGDRSLALSVWKPKDGSAAMATLSLANGSVSHEVSTVRGGGAASGAGTVLFRKSGAGGTFTLDLKTSAGATVIGTIDCSAFAQHAADGG